MTKPVDCEIQENPGYKYRLRIGVRSQLNWESNQTSRVQVCAVVAVVLQIRSVVLFQDEVVKLKHLRMSRRNLAAAFTRTLEWLSKHSAAGLRKRRLWVLLTHSSILLTNPRFFQSNLLLRYRFNPMDPDGLVCGLTRMMTKTWPESHTHPIKRGILSNDTEWERVLSEPVRILFAHNCRLERERADSRNGTQFIEYRTGSDLRPVKGFCPFFLKTENLIDLINWKLMYFVHTQTVHFMYTNRTFYVHNMNRD